MPASAAVPPDHRGHAVTSGIAQGFCCLVGSALLLQRAQRRWPLAGIGAVLYGVGAAALLPEAAYAALIPGVFGAVNAALLLLGVVIAVAAGILAAREATAAPVRLAAILGAALALAAITPAIPYLMINGVGRAMLFALAIAAGSVALLWLLRVARVGDLFRWLDRRWLVPAVANREGPAWPGRRASIALLLVATVLIFVAPRAIVLAAWGVAVLLGLHGLRRSRGAGPRLPLAAIGVAILLGWTLRWLVPISGGGWLASYASFFDAPVSAAAAVMLAPFVLLAGWLTIGLWPFEGLGPGPIASFAGAFILAGLGHGVLGDGITHATPLIGMALVLAAAHAAATDDPARFAAVIGGLGLLGTTHTTDLLMQGTLLLATVAGIWSWELRPARWGSIAWSIVGALTAVSGLWILAEALRVETVSSALVAFTAVAMLARRL